MAGAVQSCVHCGFCLPTCPTYQVLGEEMDSPRGRIVLMKQALEGTVPLEEALPHIDRCLGCLACETACPSGVPYRDLISPFRAWAEPRRERPVLDRFSRWLLLQTLPHTERFRLAAQLGRWARPLRRFLPQKLGSMLGLLPDLPPAERRLLPRYAAQGPRRATVALLAGCVQEALAPQINRATIALLTRHGVEVLVPRQQVCCGALGWHVGAKDHAEACARQNIEAFPEDLDAILTTAAGCGSCLHEYPLILQGDTPAARDAAKSFAARAQDVSVFLDKLGPLSYKGFGKDVTVALQDACHLLHGQGVSGAPRRLLQAIPGVRLVEIDQPEFCCGSAGTYNLDQPETAAVLGRRKAAALTASGADVALTGNIGCLTQIGAHLKALGSSMPVMHWVEFIEKA